MSSFFEGIDPVSYLVLGGYEAASSGRKIPSVDELCDAGALVWHGEGASIYTLTHGLLTLEFTYNADGRYSHDSLWLGRTNRKNLEKYTLNFLEKAPEQIARRDSEAVFSIFVDGTEGIIFGPKGGHAHYHYQPAVGDYVLSVIYGTDHNVDMLRMLVEANFTRLL